MSPTALRRILAASAVAEGITGIILTIVPALLLALLFGRVDDWGPRLPVARVAGTALIALGLACHPGGNDEGRTPALRAMMIFNGLMAVYFVYLAAVGMVGMLFWPAFVEHAAVAVLLFFGWWRAGLEEMPDGARGGLTC